MLHTGHPLEPHLPRGVTERLRALFPESAIVAVEPLGRGRAAGYGAPMRITLRDSRGGEHVVVFRTATPNEFGHDRRSDRAQQLLLAFDTWNGMPDHVHALDVGAIGPGGHLVSVADGGEFYLITTYAPGHLYAEDLRRIAREGRLSAIDLSRADALARYLVRLHAMKILSPIAYRRAIRDLVGHGEGIFGLLDAYPDVVPGAPPARLQAIERRCVAWRWKLRDRDERLCRTHGDFHPFNLVFDRGPSFTALDASRGGCGEPADDVTCLAINYVFFALDAPEAWREGFGPLWRGFWHEYLAGSEDGGLLDVAAPFLAWRALVLACPRWYPELSSSGRDRLLTLAERALDAPRFDPQFAEELFQ